MRSHLFASALTALALLASAPALGGWARFKLDVPAQYEDGAPLEAGDIVGYRLYWGLAPHAYTRFAEFPPSAVNDMLLEGLPDAGSVYLIGVAIAANGRPSVDSNVACHTFSGPQCVPGPFETDVLSMTFTDAGTAPPTSRRAFNFRALASCSADAPGTVVVLATAYSAARGSGWLTLPEGRNRNCTLDARLAGQNQLTAFGPAEHVFQADVPAGRYWLRVAAGDATTNNRAFFEIRDGARVLYAQPERALLPGQFIDATGVMRTATQWPSQNARREITITSGVFRFALKRPAATSAVVAHIELEGPL